MKVFVVLINAMGGVQHAGVHTTHAEADKRAAEIVVGSNPRVVEFVVRGDQDEVNVIFITQTYDRTMDIHNFEGVYGNHESAMHASGPQGQPLRYTL